MESEFIQVFTTTDKKEEAEKITKVLIEKRLAVCVQIVGPIESTYWWNGNIETAKEWLILIKSEKRLYKEIERVIKENHSYQVPEILAVPVTAGNPDYLRWLKNELR
ncbi:divalent-cation tolerance protein CutA [Desulfurobacterium crinifex]